MTSTPDSQSIGASVAHLIPRPIGWLKSERDLSRKKFTRIIGGLVVAAIATVVTMCVAWEFTHDTSDSLWIGVIDTTIKLFVYYGHERVWDKVSLGREKPPEYNI